MQKLILLGLLIIGLALPAAAQEVTEAPPTESASTSLTYGTPVSGSIDDTTVMQEWTLETLTADRIQVQVERTGGSLIPDVQILDAAGTELANSYGPVITSDRAQLDNFYLPQGGSYSIRVGRYYGIDGVSSGTYDLTVTPLSTALDNINNTTVIAPVEIGVPLQGEITPTHWSHRYTYTALAADAIRVRAVRTSGTLQPEVEVMDSAGNVLTTGYTDYDGASASLDRTLDAAGEITVVVRRARGFDGATNGGYQLQVEMIGSGEGSPNLASFAGDVVYDTALTGSISGAQWYQDWRLSVTAGDSIRLFIERADATETLQPEVALLGGSGQELRRGYTENDGATAQMEYTLEAPGEYIVRASRSAGQTGVTSGAYTLTVTLIGSGVGSEALQGATGSIEMGAPVEGEITPLRWEDTWTFAGQADQQIVVTVTRTSGNLIPLVDLRDANGQSLRLAYPADSRDSATLEYVLPAAGEYRIVVLRDQGQAGLTTGSYQLSVAAPAQ